MYGSSRDQTKARLSERKCLDAVLNEDVTMAQWPGIKAKYNVENGSPGMPLSLDTYPEYTAHRRLMRTTAHQLLVQWLPYWGVG